MDLAETKIALAHDSLTQAGGAERVLDELHQVFPDSPVFTLVADNQAAREKKNWQIRTSQLQIIYGVYPHFQRLLPLIPWALSTLDFSGFQLVLSDSSGFAKNLFKPKGSVHVCYCHTPPRFLWSDFDYVRQEVPWWLRLPVRFYLQALKGWDLRGTDRVDHFIANSKEVQLRIKKYYNRDSVVIYPGIDTKFWHPTKPKEDYFLLAGRLQAYKKNDFVIKVFNKLGWPLHVAGTGRQEQYLKKIAKGNINFLGQLSDEHLRDEYSAAKGYLFPQLEDFGLMPLEAAACGTATLALGQGGSLETIVPGKTGEYFTNYDEEELERLLTSWRTEKYRGEDLIKHAEDFSLEKFHQRILAFLRNLR